MHKISKLSRHVFQDIWNQKRIVLQILLSPHETLYAMPG
jgi:hypothetical protein